MAPRFAGAALAMVLLVAACAGNDAPRAEPEAVPNAPSVAPTRDAAPEESRPPADLTPSITTVDAGAGVVGRFERIDLSVTFVAEYDNPFDARDIALDAVFTGPDDSSWSVPGFYDGDEWWGFRFTPSSVGPWRAEITVTDRNGTSESVPIEFEVTESDRKGWVTVGSRVDPAFSDRYFAHLDGTPWFGLGHADLAMTLGGYDGTTFSKMVEMVEYGENLEMWWPLWNNNFIQSTHDRYQAGPMRIIDLVLVEAERNDIQIAYTIWNHQLLRTNNHRWGAGLWGSNGFRELVEIDEFFTDVEAWAWQENLYRYTIARWAHSPAIAMWQTVSEINGTESYEHTDAWHERVNAYFLEHDPYRHPTSGTKSGGEFWPEAFAVADVPQMHVYEQFHENPVGAAKIMADWTIAMWNDQEKPNWIGEYGQRSPRSYPEFFHNTIWATVAAGAATGPIEWNDRSGYGRFGPDLAADQRRLRDFLDTVPLVALDPSQVTVSSDDPEVRGWGVAGRAGGLVWVQDFLGESTDFAVEEDIDLIRARPPRADVELTVAGLPTGTYRMVPYETWTGTWIEPVDLICAADTTCSAVLPAFTHDLALRIEPA